MKKLLLSLFASLSILTSVNAQTPWSFDFGTSTGTYNTNNTVSLDFLPLAATGGGTSMVRAKNGAGGGSLNLIANYTGALGSGSEFNIVSSSSASANKFGIYDWTPAKVATVKFKMKFNSGDAETWSFEIGDGVNYTNGSVYAAAATFTQLEFATSGTTVTVRNRAGATLTEIVGLTFNKNTNYELELYCNNSTGTVNYTRNGAQSVAANTYDLWVNGTRVGNDLAKGSIPDDANIDSFMFYGLNSTGNVNTLSLDDIFYANFTPPTFLPVSLTSFTAKANLQNIDLAWNTASEKDNSHFEVLRSGDGKTFTKIGEIKGAGTTDAAQNYTFTDKNALPGLSYYQFNQVDYNGNATLSKVEAVKSNVAASNFKVASSKQDGTIKLTVFAANEGKATLKIYDINGRKVTEKELSLSKGYSNISVPFNGGRGLHIASLTTATETVTQKFIQ